MGIQIQKRHLLFGLSAIGLIALTLGTTTTSNTLGCDACPAAGDFEVVFINNRSEDVTIQVRPIFGNKINISVGELEAQLGPGKESRFLLQAGRYTWQAYYFKQTGEHSWYSRLIASGEVSQDSRIEISN